jgi:phospholipid/cholesterol/gamma-HCH transport system ATP-binding protein
MPPEEHPRAAIELEGVVKEFGSARVLDGVDLVVPAGEITVLLGPSGAGKTVTIKHILGLLEPSDGVVRVNGKDLGAISEEQLYEVRRGMSVVLQGALPFTCGLFYSLSVYENVAYGLRERKNWDEERIDRVTRDALRMVGLHDHAERMPEDLSGGETKRTALARALALESGIFIVDDLDAGLDDVRLTLLCQIIREAQEDTDATVLVTTHDMQVARDLADYVALIHEGRIVASGEADAVLASEEPFVRQFVSGATAGPLQLRDT